MNWDQVAGKWSQYKGKVKERWGRLTDDDLDIIDGKRQQLVGKIQERYGIAKDIAENQADEFARTIRLEAQETRDDREMEADTKSRARRAGQK